jgi:hypothetical protein
MKTTYPDMYMRKAIVTRKRRQEAGAYKRPTAEQDAAFRRYISGGERNLLPGDAALLATHPWLLDRQKAAWAELAAQEAAGK